MNKKILFLTGTRADFGKLKSLIQQVEGHSAFDSFLFVTGMHLQHTYGYTLIEIERCGFKNIHTFANHTQEHTMDLTLAKTIEGLSDYVRKLQPDLLVVHGDRVEALAGAIVGSLNNIFVAHVEGGELSGTVDELIRHSISKLSHIHFVANLRAQQRLVQMGELPESIFVIGSPDMDIMFSSRLPDLDTVKSYYQIPFADYALVLFHPVTTEAEHQSEFAENLVNALLEDDSPYVVIYPNNDLGSKAILEAYVRLKNHSRFRVFPSLRFEYFLTLLKHAKFMIGNSSAGIREAPAYGIPVINIGTRQQNRDLKAEILNVDYQQSSIARALANIKTQLRTKPAKHFGNGKSAEQFLACLTQENFWKINHQKQFRDY